MKDNELGKNLLHLALCMSNTAVEEMVKEIFTPTKHDDTEDSKNLPQKQKQPPPGKGKMVYFNL